MPETTASTINSRNTAGPGSFPTGKCLHRPKCNVHYAHFNWLGDWYWRLLTLSYAIRLHEQHWSSEIGPPGFRNGSTLRFGLRLHEDAGLRVSLACLVSNVTALGADVFVDFQPYYSCQNSSGIDNYEACVNATQGPPLPPSEAPSFTNVRFEGLRGTVWRPVWLTCLPEKPCENISFMDVRLEAQEPAWACSNVYGSANGEVFPPATGCFA